MHLVLLTVALLLGTVSAATEEALPECFSYRREITYINTGAPITDPTDILIEVDTLALVTGDIDPPRFTYAEGICEDMRFRIKEGSWLDHWFENDCPSVSNRIWVQLPESELPISNVTIEWYYLCQDGIDESYGSMIAWDGWWLAPHIETGCGEGWSFLDLSDRFLKSAPYDASDEPNPLAREVDGNFENHIHTRTGMQIISVLDVLNGDSPPIDWQRLESGVALDMDAAMVDHSHAVDIDLTPPMVSALPPYLDVSFCNRRRLGSPFLGQLYGFDGVNSDPAGSARFASLNNHLLRGGAYTGTPGGRADHYHSIPDQSFVGLPPTTQKLREDWATPDWDASSGSHTHQIVPVDSDYAGNQRLQKSMTFAEVIDLGTFVFTDDMFFFATGLPPFGFEQSTNYGSTYIMGGDDAATQVARADQEHVIPQVDYMLQDAGDVNQRIPCDQVVAPYFVALSTHRHANVTNLAFTDAIDEELNHYEVVILERKAAVPGLSAGILGEEENIRPPPRPPEVWPSWAWYVVGGGSGGLIIGIVVCFLVVVCICCCWQKARSNKQAQTHSDVITQEMVENAEREARLKEESQRLEEEKERERREREKLEAQLQTMKQKSDGSSHSRAGSTILLGDIKLITFNDVQRERELGKGSLGFRIFKGSFDGQPVLFRAFDESVFRSTGQFNVFKFFEMELKQYSGYDHPNILKFIAYSKPPQVGVVTEYAANATLKIFFRMKTGQLSFEQKRDLVEQIAQGMFYLHERSVVHADLRAENIFITREFSPKIDFGFNGAFRKDYAKSRYAAPELVTATEGQEMSLKVDVFSFGILMYEIAVENFDPYPGKVADIGVRVSRDPNFRPPLAQKARFLPGWYANMCSQSWSANADVRPSFATIVQTIKDVKEMEGGDQDTDDTDEEESDGSDDSSSDSSD